MRLLFQPILIQLPQGVVEHVGARLVMIDCEHGKFTMDYEKLEAAITERTKAIIPVDLFGIPCGYDTIFDIVERKRIYSIQ